MNKYVYATKIAERFASGRSIVMPELESITALKRVMQISLRPTSVLKPIKGISVYIDFTHNRKSNYFPPIIRIATFDRKKFLAYNFDLSNLESFSTETYYKAERDDEKEEINTQLLALDRIISNLRTDKMGLLSYYRDPDSQKKPTQLPNNIVKISRDFVSYKLSYEIHKNTEKETPIENQIGIIVNTLESLCSSKPLDIEIDMDYLG